MQAACVAQKLKSSQQFASEVIVILEDAYGHHLLPILNVFKK